MRWLAKLLILLLVPACQTQDVHHSVAQRRAGVAIICHRGAHEFAHENTLEAYRATFEMGGDGNEIDIRQTKDGVLVLFHDDMLDVNLKAFGDVSDYTFAELERFKFRNEGRFGRACRIPTLKQVFELHKRYAGLIHLDIKVPGIDTKIADMLDEMDMWDHISNVSEYNSENIRKNPKLHARPYKAGLYEDHSEVFPELIAAALKKSGDDIICDDPRGVARALGRRLSKLSEKPLLGNRPFPLGGYHHGPADRILEVVRDSSDSSPTAIQMRAIAADMLGDRGEATPDAFSALEFRARHRTFNANWRYHGLDGAIALRSLIVLAAPGALQLSREMLWLDDPAVISLNNPEYKVPPSWVDFRIKNVVFPALEKYPGTESEKLCRDYLALSDEEAKKIGPPQFEPAAHTLLTISPRMETAVELMHHRLRVVRGRTILDCLAKHKESWAMKALREAAPHALAYIPPD